MKTMKINAKRPALIAVLALFAALGCCAHAAENSLAADSLAAAENIETPAAELYVQDSPASAAPLSAAGAATDSIGAEDQDQSLLQRVIAWYERNTNYYTITALMAVESSFIPFPSEVVIPPAAYIASDPESDMNVVLVVVFGTLGALIGALINYGLSLWLGRPIIYKFADSKPGHLLLLSSEKVKKAEDYFVKNGNVSTFIGRLVPGIRQLISIPAGLAKMNIGSFILYTTLGAGIWNAILALIGYLAHGQKELIDRYSSELSWVLLGLGAAFVIYLIVKSVRNKKCKKQQSTSSTES